MLTCTNPRLIDSSNVATKTPDDAWADLKKADEERDLDDLKEAIKVYHKAEPETTWLSLEQAFRTQKFNTHLIANVSSVITTQTGQI